MLYNTASCYHHGLPMSPKWYVILFTYWPFLWRNVTDSCRLSVGRSGGEAPVYAGSLYCWETLAQKKWLQLHPNCGFRQPWDHHLRTFSLSSCEKWNNRTGPSVLEVSGCSDWETLVGLFVNKLELKNLQHIRIQSKISPTCPFALITSRVLTALLESVSSVKEFITLLQSIQL